MISKPGLKTLALLAGAFLSTQAAWADPVKIGIVGPTAGPAANTGLTVQNVWQMVIDGVNAEGGLTIDGEKRELELIGADSQSKPSVGVTAAQRLLARDGVDILVGDTLHSDIALALMELSAAHPTTPFFIPLPTSSTIGDRIATEPAKYGNVWRWNVENTGYGASVADFLQQAVASGARDYPNKTYAFITEASDFSATILASVQKNLDGTGWTLATSETVPIGSTDFYTQIAKVKALKPDVVITIMTTANSGLAYVKQTKEQQVGYEDVAVYYPSTAAFKAGIGKDGQGLVFFSGSFDPATERGKAFAALMKEQGIGATGDAVLGYCSANILMQAITAAQSVKAEAINKAMLTIDDDSCPNYWRSRFDPARHSLSLGPDLAFATGAQIYGDGTKFFIFYPDRAATRKMDDFPTE